MRGKLFEDYSCSVITSAIHVYALESFLEEGLPTSTIQLYTATS